MTKAHQPNAPTEQRKTALLVGVQLPETTDREQARSLAELTRLVDTLGLKVVGTITQKLKSTNAASVVGPGKLMEIAQWTGGAGVVEIETHRTATKAQLKGTFVNKNAGETGEEEFEDGEIDELEDEDEFEEENEDEPSELSQMKPPKKPVDFVVFDSELTPTQLRNVERALESQVMDRTGVIVEIFHRHAQTPAAQAQVEIARLTYLTPRLRATGGGERQGGGIGAKGAGETKHELDKRRIRDRIAELKGNLEKIHEENALRRSKRKNSMKVALVGYTNAGKSSLMRALTGSEVLVADKLFATLDTTVRSLYPETKPKILATDTVGFIQKLPHELVASFRSTLDEALDASLLLYVVDASDENMPEQLATTKEVLSEIEAGDVEHLLILNKADQLTDIDKRRIHATFPDGIFLCTRDKESVQKLRDIIVAHFEKNMAEATLKIPYQKGAAVAEFHQVMRVLSETHDEDGTLIKVRGFSGDLERIQKQFDLEIQKSGSKKK